MEKSLPIIFATLVMVSALTGCAGRNSSPEQNNATVQSSETTISQPVTSTIGASSPAISPNASAAYEKLIAYKTGNYGQQSVANFNTALASTPDELTFKEEMQNYLNGLSEAEITDGNIKEMLIDKSAELANSLSTENMKLSPCEIYLLETYDAGTESIQQK